MRCGSLRVSVGVVAILLATAGCAANSRPTISLAPLTATGQAQEPPGVTHNADQPAPPEPGPKTPGHIAALWLPNRILDVCDIPRAGVDLGPGIGFDGCVTHYMRIAAMMRTSGGIGYETFRHSPAKFAHEEYVVGGPQSAEAGLGAGWYLNTWDVRLEAHLLIVGAHACVNIGEIGDFFAGLVTLDPMDDDY